MLRRHFHSPTHSFPFSHHFTLFRCREFAPDVSNDLNAYTTLPVAAKHLSSRFVLECKNKFNKSA